MPGRPPDPLLLGLDAPELRVPADMAAILWPGVERFYDEMVRMGTSSKVEELTPLVKRWRHLVWLHEQEMSARGRGGDGVSGMTRQSRHGTAETPPATAQRAGAARRPLTRTEAAERLGCSPRNIPRLVAKGEIDGEKVGRDWQIDAASVEAFARRSGRVRDPDAGGRALGAAAS